MDDGAGPVADGEWPLGAQRRDLRRDAQQGASNCVRLGLGSPIVRAASRLALRATARSTAAALTRPARWALGRSDGRHGVPAKVSVGPAVTIPEHGIKSGEHFAHDRDDRDFRLLARGNEAMVEGAQYRVEPERGQGWHVERVANRYAAAIDVALPTKPARYRSRTAPSRPVQRSASGRSARVRAARPARCRQAWRRRPASSTAGGSVGQGLVG